MRIASVLMSASILLGAGLALAADRSKRGGDAIWTHPAYASLGVQSIAFLPAASYDKSFKSERTIENQLSLALRTSGYRWISAQVSKDMLRAAMGESVIAGIARDILDDGRIDSLAAIRLCRALRVTAVLSARVDLFEQTQVEWNQSGKPTTTVQPHAALVDS